MSALKIAIAGVNGRMGRVLVEAVNNHPDTVLSGALEHSGSEVLGLDAGFASGIKTGIAISDDVDAVLAQSDVIGLLSLGILPLWYSLYYVFRSIVNTKELTR